MKDHREDVYCVINKRCKTVGLHAPEWRWADRSLPFPYVKLYIRKDDALLHTVYRKMTHTDWYLNALSHYHLRLLQSLVASSVNKAYDPEHLDSKRTHIQELRKNGFKT